jgi:hypothetical protein
MNRKRVILIAAAAAVGSSRRVRHLRSKRRDVVTPTKVKGPPAAAGAVETSGIAGIQTVVLKGDPSKAGLSEHHSIPDASPSNVCLHRHGRRACRLLRAQAHNQQCRDQMTKVLVADRVQVLPLEEFLAALPM